MAPFPIGGCDASETLTLGLFRVEPHWNLCLHRLILSAMNRCLLLISRLPPLLPSSPIYLIFLPFDLFPSEDLPRPMI